MWFGTLKNQALQVSGRDATYSEITGIPEVAVSEALRNCVIPPGSQNVLSSSEEQRERKSPLRFTHLVAVILVILVGLRFSIKADEVIGEPPEFRVLLSSDLTKDWKCYHSDSEFSMQSVWRMTPAEDGGDPVLVCTGQPKGFLYTTETFADFELTLEWKFPKDANGNSGILLFVQEEPRIWPTSMQVQLHQPKAGSVIPSGDAKSDGMTDKTDLARPIDSWNECRIVSRGGKLTVDINGTSAGETTGITPCSGRIGLQSEGSEVHFRRIRIRPLPPATGIPSV
ncbi:MAG: DUF1080 domain-containing protein [Planctomyces sp.]